MPRYFDVLNGRFGVCFQIYHFMAVSGPRPRTGQITAFQSSGAPGHDVKSALECGHQHVLVLYSFIVFLFWELACILPVVTILVKILFIFRRDIIKICAYCIINRYHFAWRVYVVSFLWPQGVRGCKILKHEHHLLVERLQHLQQPCCCFCRLQRRQKASR